MIDFDMDCSLTEGGWFEIKTFGTGGSIKMKCCDNF